MLKHFFKILLLLLLHNNYYLLLPPNNGSNTLIIIIIIVIDKVNNNNRNTTNKQKQKRQLGNRTHNNTWGNVKMAYNVKVLFCSENKLVTFITCAQMCCSKKANRVGADIGYRYKTSYEKNHHKELSILWMTKITLWGKNCQPSTPAAHAVIIAGAIF